MKPIDSHEISNFSKSDLKALAIEQSQFLVVTTGMIRNLEKQVDHLAEAVVKKNQKLLFSAEALQRMRPMQFGKSSEKWDEQDHSPLFGTTGMTFP